MKNILLTLLLVTIGSTVFAQTYKIVISYDDNGNRIKRERICLTCPSPPDIPPPGSNDANTQAAIDKIATMEGLLFEVYPNPALTTITVKTDALTAAEQPTLQVLDAMGRVVRKARVTATQQDIDLSTFADGSYYVTLTVRDTVQRKKIVKVTE